MHTPATLEAAKSLIPLLEKSENVITKELRSIKPFKDGATAGLRQLEGDVPHRILQAVGLYLCDELECKHYEKEISYEQVMMLVVAFDRSGAFSETKVTQNLIQIGSLF